MIAALARPPVLRLRRSRRGWLVAAGWFALGLAMAALARLRGSAHPTDDVLIEAYGPVVLPILTYVLVGAAVGSGSLATTVLPVVRLGAGPTRAAAHVVVVTIVTCSVVAAAVACAMAIASHGRGDPPLAGDAWSSAYAGGLGGGAYGAWFLFGSNLTKRGGARTVLLLVDWVLGASDGAAALFTPRGHVRNLLGGTPPMELSQRASSLALLALVLAYGLAASRQRRP